MGKRRQWADQSSTERLKWGDVAVETYIEAAGETVEYDLQKASRASIIQDEDLEQTPWSPEGLLLGAESRQPFYKLTQTGKHVRAVCATILRTFRQTSYTDATTMST